MVLLLICVVIGLAVLIYLKSSLKKASAFSSLDQGADWLRAEGIIPDTVLFSAYRDPSQVSVPNATVIVGVGQDANGTYHGFVFETRPDKSIEGRILASPAVVARDKQAAALARTGGSPIMTQLGAWSLQWMAEGRAVAAHPSSNSTS